MVYLTLLTLNWYSPYEIVYFLLGYFAKLLFGKDSGDDLLILHLIGHHTHFVILD